MHLSSSHTRRAVVGGAVLASILVASACAPSREVALPDRDDVVEAYVELGLEPSVAGCVVDLGIREFGLDGVAPEAAMDDQRRQLVDEIVLGCQAAADLLRRQRPDVLAFDDEAPFTLGDDPVLDQLWRACERGNGFACDELWETSTIGTEYEEFGVTCGHRFDVLDCSAELGGTPIR